MKAQHPTAMAAPLRRNDFRFAASLALQKDARRRTLGWPVSVVLHAAALGTLLGAPLFTAQELPVPPTISDAPPLRVPYTVRVDVRPAPSPPPPNRKAPTPRPNAGASNPGPSRPIPHDVPDGIPTDPGPEFASNTPLVDGGGCPDCDGDGPPALEPVLGDGAGETTSRVYIAGHEVTAPRKLHNVPPVYPDLAQRISLQGTVVIECIIDPAGRVTDVRVLTGHALLNEAALAAVSQWRYTPTLVGTTPVSVAMTVTVRFTLTRGSR